MQELELSKKILDDVVDNGTPFSLALKNVFQINAELRPLRHTVSSLLGCELRHHILFNYLVKNLEGYEEADKRYLSLAMGNAHYLHYFSYEEMNTALKEVLGEEKLAKAKALLDQDQPLDTLIPETVSKDSMEYLSLRYNTPEWLVHIWSHFGYVNMRKTLQKNVRPATFSLRVRTSKMTTKEVLENPDFHPTFAEDIVTYEGKVPLRKLEIYRQHKLFFEAPAIKQLLDDNKINPPGEAMLYSGNEEPYLEQEFLESYGTGIGLNLATPEIDDKLAIKRIIKGDKLHNVNFFSAPDPSFMDASISNKQQLILCAPKSSNFDAIRSTPDFLLHFDKSQLDTLIANQKAALEGCAKYLDDEGTLIYLVTTLNKKEGQQIIKNFLKEHEGFSLVSERQIFPFEEGDTTAYYAILSHKIEAIAPPIMNEIPLIAKVEPPSFRAGQNEP